MFGAPARTDGGAQPSVASAAEPPKELPPGDGSAAPKDGDIPRKPKAQLLKALEWDPQLDIAKAVRRFAREVLEARLPATALNNSNEFRFKRLYTKEMDDTLKGEFSLPSDDVLKVYARRDSDCEWVMGLQRAVFRFREVSQ